MGRFLRVENWLQSHRVFRRFMTLVTRSITDQVVYLDPNATREVEPLTTKIKKVIVYFVPTSKLTFVCLFFLTFFIKNLFLNVHGNKLNKGS